MAMAADDQLPFPIHIDIEPCKDPPNVNKLLEWAPGAASVLTRINAGHFTVCLSLGSQLLLWNTIREHVNKTPQGSSLAFLLLWWLSLCALILLSFLYLLRCIFYFRLVKAEFLNHAGINFLFIPWISWLLLLQTQLPFDHPHQYLQIRHILSLSFIIPVVILDVKIYGQWFTTEKRFLSVLANPTSQLSVMGNFVGAWTAGLMGWNESAVCIFTLGLAHYLVVFITLYQRLSGPNYFPVMLRPVFFLFVAAPSTAALAWSSISGSFGMPCKLLFFLSLFLFTSLICRPALFKKSMERFNIAWWAYSFPLTFLALASAQYAENVKGGVASGLMLLLSGLSVLVFVGIIIITAANTDRLLQQNYPNCLT